MTSTAITSLLLYVALLVTVASRFTDGAEGFMKYVAMAVAQAIV
jgi:hypothetical protein